MDQSSISARFIARGFYPKFKEGDQSDIDRSVISSILNSNPNRISFYKHKKLKPLQSSRSYNEERFGYRKVLKNQGNIFLLSQIFDNFKPLKHQQKREENQLVQLIDHENTKVVQNLQLWNKWKNHSVEVPKQGYLDKQKLEKLRCLFEYRPSVDENKIMQFIKQLQQILSKQGFRNKEYVYHSLSKKIQKSILQDIQYIDVLSNFIKDDIKNIFDMMENINLQISRVQAKSHSDKSQTDHLKAQLHSLLQLTIFLQKCEKRKKELKEDIVHCLIFFYKSNLKFGHDYLKEGLTKYVLYLLFLKYDRIKPSDISQGIPIESRTALVQLSLKSLQFQYKQLKFQHFILKLKKYLQKNKKVLSCLHDYEAMIKQEDRSLGEEDQEQIVRFLRSYYWKSILKDESMQFQKLQNQFSNLVKSSRIEQLEEQEINKFLHSITMSKFKIERSKKLQKLNFMMKDRQENRIDPILFMHIVNNQNKLKVSRKTSQELIREQAIKTIKKHFTPKYKIDSIMSNQVDKVSMQRITHTNEHLLKIQEIINFFREHILSTYLRLQKQIGIAKRQFKKSVDSQIHRMAQFFVLNSQNKFSFLKTCTMLFGEVKGYQSLMKNPMIRQFESKLGEDEEDMDYVMLNRVSNSFLSIFGKRM